MSTLHTVNKSPFTHTTLRSCIAVCAEADTILLLEDGVFGALASSPYADALNNLSGKGVKVYALIGDIRARGLAERLMPGITPVDYPGFVQLSTSHKRVQSWY